jgi:hypothetical protein
VLAHAKIARRLARQKSKLPCTQQQNGQCHQQNCNVANNFHEGFFSSGWRVLAAATASIKPGRVSQGLLAEGRWRRKRSEKSTVPLWAGRAGRQAG